MADHTVSHYKIIEQIGEGGMGVVYRAEDTRLERTVALKFLHSHRLDDKEQRARFIREAQAAGRLNHPGIVTIHDVGEDRGSGLLYIAMEFLEGGDLEMRNLEGMSVDAALDLVETIGDCLEFLHRKNIVHRDIKPANILFHSDGTPVLTGIDLAYTMGMEAFRNSGDRTDLPVPSLVKHFVNGEYGQKTGRGWYDYKK